MVEGLKLISEIEKNSKINAFALWVYLGCPHSTKEKKLCQAALYSVGRLFLSIFCIMFCE